MKMDKATEVAVIEVEQFSKLGALKLQQNNLQKALEAYRHAYQSAQLLGHNGYIQRVCAFNLGAICVSSGSYTDGLTYLKQAEPPEGCRDGRSNGDLYFNFGLAYEGLRNTEKMKHYYSQALKEYQSEKDNVMMEAEVLIRLGKVCVACGQYYEAEACVKQLSEAYKKLGDTMKQLQTQAEQASLLLRIDKVEEAERIADDCFIKSKDQKLSSKTANILIELSLVYTQMCKYDQALQCCLNAVSVVGFQDADLKQVAVLYQNLGVIYNYMGQYEASIEYHQAAANKYAEMNNRKSQGHCFINLGYAYSQMKDIDQAGEYFLHSLQAAKDCGDRKSEWQSLEALGSVAYHHGDLKRSQDYYKSALVIVAKSSDAEDTNIQDRILEKLTNVINMQVSKPDEPVIITRREEVQSRTSVKSSNEILKKVGNKDGSVIAVKKDGKIKFLRVRRSGTLQKFNKFALGLDVSMSPLPTGYAARQISLGLDPDEDVFSASTIDISDLEEEAEEGEEEERAEADRNINQNREKENELDGEKLDGEMIEEKLDNTDSEDEKMQVFDAMREVASHGDETMTSSQGEVTADIRNPKQAVYDEDDTQSEDNTEADISSDSENNDEQEQNDEEKDEKRDKHQDPPRIPTLMPQSSHLGTLRTYEVPVKREMHVRIADHRSPDSKDVTKKTNSGGKEVSASIKASTDDDDGINFFHSEDRRLNKEDEETMEQSGYADGTIYESIRLPSLQNQNSPEVDESSRNNVYNEEDDTVHEQLPKGVRDRIEYKAFQADMKARRANEIQTENKQTVKRSSRVCIVM